MDKYLDGGAQGSLWPVCDPGLTVRGCIQYMFQGSPTNYVSQGVRGVRFFYGLGGGFYSTPFHSDGTVDEDWVTNIYWFFRDLKSYGIQRITPTPVFLGNWSSVPGPCDGCLPPQQANVLSCGGLKDLQFYKWVPFGLETSTFWPDGQGNNQAYSCAAANPYFWGWGKYFALVGRILDKARQVRDDPQIPGSFTITDLDLENEIKLLNFTVLARLIYDNTTLTDVLSTIRNAMSARGFTSGRVTFSTPMDRPSIKDYNCSSVYQDSAMIIHASELHAAYNAGPIGMPSGFAKTFNLACGGSTTGMKGLLVAYSQPTVTNIHSHVCVEGKCIENTVAADSTITATNLYSSVYQFLLAHSLTGNQVVFGETNHTAPNNCDGYHPVRPGQNVNGYRQSSLYYYKGSSTSMRVWYNMHGSCYGNSYNPLPVNPPYGP